MRGRTFLRIYRFDAEVGRKVDAFNSVNFVMSKVVHLAAEARVSCAHLGPNGRIGHHQAVVPQLLLVVQGAGWVRDEAADRISVTIGHAVYWEQDKWHETTTDTGLIAIVIESEALDPADFMPLLE
jgi:quercetin dioxygenase-like cupin family protein